MSRLTNPSFSRVLGRRKTTYDDVLEELQEYRVVDLDHIRSREDFQEQLLRKMQSRFSDRLERELWQAFQNRVAQGDDDAGRELLPSLSIGVPSGFSSLSREGRAKTRALLRQGTRVIVRRGRPVAFGVVRRGRAAGSTFAYDALTGRRVSKQLK